LTKAATFRRTSAARHCYKLAILTNFSELVRLGSSSFVCLFQHQLILAGVVTATALLVVSIILL